jgi:allene oxide cyclase-like protein
MRTTLKRTLGLGLAAIALGAAVAVLESGASAQDPTTSTLTFKTLERGSTFTHVRNTKPRSRRANNTGDLIVFTNPVADASRNVVGTLYADCTTTKGARNFLRSITTCAGVVELRDGTLTLQANSKPGVPTTIGAVTGGTGAYANARGTFVAEDTSGDLTITLAT